MMKRISKKSKRSGSTEKLVKSRCGGDSILSVFLGVDIDSSFFQKCCSAHSSILQVKKGLSSVGEGWQEIQKDKPALISYISNYLAHTTYEIYLSGVKRPCLAPEGQNGTYCQHSDGLTTL